MSTFVVFLRAINLGAKRRFPQAEQVAVTAAAGFDDVRVHLATGNLAVGTRMRSAARVSAALEAAYLADRGFEVPVAAFTPAELRAVLADAEELAEDGAGVQYVSLLREEPSADGVAALEARTTDAERVVVRGRAAHLLLGKDYHSASLSNAVVERHLGVATNRNVTVLRAVVGKWC